MGSEAEGSANANGGGGGATKPVFVEDLFLTDSFLIKGRLSSKYQRLSRMLEDIERQFVSIEDAELYSLQGGETVRTPRVLVNLDEVLLAHEFVQVAVDETQRTLAHNQKHVPVRTFHNGRIQLEVSGRVEPHAYEPGRGPGKRFFVIQQPQIRGIDTANSEALRALASLEYAIVQKSKLSYIYDFGD